MSETATLPKSAVGPQIEHFDVLIVGAGISGVGGAYHLQTQRPGTSFVILETMEAFGGTWRQHRYPGTRSDSDLYTFGYRFKAWTNAPIASRGEILSYMEEVIEENDIARHIRYRHQIKTASWSSQDNRWTIEARRTDTDETVWFTAGFLWMCQGYYRQSEGYTPEWAGMADFKGQVVHPQTWPEDLDYAGKRIVVIGSGATAATLIPNLAGDAEHVTMLQRSPTFFATGRNANDLADQLRELDVDPMWIHEIVRRKVLKEQQQMTAGAMAFPDGVKQMLIEGVKAHLPEGYDLSHFTPNYRPWRQRIAFVPNADLFQGIKSGKADVVTAEIDRFTETGIRLKDGRELPADIVITATGFSMNVMGDIDFSVDGKPVNFAETVNYRGMMFTGVPNLVWVFGYFRASWTLRADLVADFVCRLLTHMQDTGKAKVTVELRPEDQDMELLEWIDPENFNPNYLMRAMHLLPKRGTKPEWQHSQDYWVEKQELPLIDLDGAEFRYS